MVAYKQQKEELSLYFILSLYVSLSIALTLSPSFRFLSLSPSLSPYDCSRQKKQ